VYILHFITFLKRFSCK